MFPRKLSFFEFELMHRDLWWQYIKVQKLIKGGNYSRAEYIGGNTVFQNMSHSSDGDAELKLGLTCTLPCWSSKDNSFFKVFLFQISIVPFLKPQMITSWRIFKSFEGHFNPKIFNPMLQPQTFQPWTLQPQTFQLWIWCKFGVEAWGSKLWG